MPAPAPSIDPAARLQRDAARSTAAACVGVAAAAALATQYADSGHAPVATALALFASAAAALLRDLPLHLPQPRFGAANCVTLARLGLAALLAAAVLHGGSAAAGTAVALATTAAALDGVDGWLARRRGTESRFGARFDMETDQLLIVALSIAAWHLDKAGAWVLLVGVPRYAFVAAAARWPWLARPLPPSRRRKAACVAQTVSLTVCIAPAVPLPWSAAAAAGGFAALCYSFAVDVAWLRRNALTHSEETPR
ncbi:MAG: CDP-alcohol phosphatidyltransferase family protein [Pseudomonadota bacterium]